MKSSNYYLLKKGGVLESSHKGEKENSIPRMISVINYKGQKAGKCSMPVPTIVTS